MAGGIPYLEASTEEFGRAFAERATLRFVPPQDPVVVELTGPCGRCGDRITTTVPVTVVLLAGPTDERRIPVLCTCDEEHAGRPAGKKGCGAGWSVLYEGRSA